MSTNQQEALRAAATGQTPAKREPASFPQMLTAYKDQIAAALPKHINGDRMARIALTCFRQTPKLADCDPKSVFAAVIMGSQLGLEPGIQGQAYLIPYGRQCQFVPGWRGIQDLVNRSGRASTWTGAVYDGDEFEYQLGSAPYLNHRPAGSEDDVAKLRCVYAIGRVKGAEYPVIEVWNKDKVLRHRDRYNKVGAKHYSYQHLEMYGRKVVLLQVIKYMPTSIEVASAIALEQSAENNGQIIDLNDAVSGVFMAPPEESEQTGAQASSSGATGAAPTAQNAIGALKSQDTLDNLEKMWTKLRGEYAGAGAEIPVEVQSVYDGRRETLTQAIGR